MRNIPATTHRRSLMPVFGALSRSPWTGLESEIDRFFETALGGVTGLPANDAFPIDLYEDNDNTYVRADLPGVTRDDINVELVEGYLTINATRKNKTADGEDTLTYNRSISVPAGTVQADRISAAYENGVLTVTLPKKEESKPRKVTVAVK